MIVVDLRSVVEELDALMEDSTAYLNRLTGELYSIRDDDAELIEDADSEDDLPEWLDGDLERLRAIVDSEEWLALPTRFDIHEWASMDAFARGIADPELRDELMSAIRHRGAFRTFKDAIYRRGIQQDWFAFRYAALERIAADWLDEHGISYTQGNGVAPSA